MSNVRIRDRNDSSLTFDLTAVVYGAPEALVFREAAETTLRAQICVGCGFTELYADSAGPLWDAYQKAGGRQ